MLVANVAPTLVRRRHLTNRLSAAGPGGVALVCAPAGSGKTMLLRSWMEAVGEHVAWVTVERREQDAQRFWRALAGALAGASGGSDAVGAAVRLRGEAAVEQLVTGLRALEHPVVLVVDDLHELRSADALRLLELLLARIPATLRVALATREEPQLGLHRLRLADAVTELRAADLRFSEEEARELLEASGIALSGDGVALLSERTEGWAAGLRLAAISLAGHPEPERFVREFSGSERTVAGYLLAEVLAQQPPEVRELLLRTSVLDSVSGPLADFVTGSAGSEAVLQSLADANAFVTPLDAGRRWFRYHQMFADLLRLELRRVSPRIIAPLHRAAAEWHEHHGDLLDAVHHAQAAGDWRLATRLLAADHAALGRGCRRARVRELLAAYPAEAPAADPELALVFAAVHAADGALEEGVAYLDLAEGLAAAVPEERKPRFDLQLAATRISLARRRGDGESARAAIASVEAALPAQQPGEVASAKALHAAALMELGVADMWSMRLDDAFHELEQALVLARRVGRPCVEACCLAHLALAGAIRGRPLSIALELAAEAVALADEHDCDENAGVAAAAFAVGGSLLVLLGRFDEAERRLDRAQRALPPGSEPGTESVVHLARGLMRLAQGRAEQGLASFQAAERMQALLVDGDLFRAGLRRRIALAHVGMGDTAAARAALASLSEQERERPEVRTALAAVALAEGDPQGARALLAAPLAAGAATAHPPCVPLETLLFDAAASEQLGDWQAAEASLERALDLAEPDGLVLPFAFAPVRDLIERHAGHRTAHATLLTEIRDVLGAGLARREDDAARVEHELSDAELRVVRYLPSNLKAPEIAAELFVSPNTVRTHVRHIYAKLDAHSRRDAVARARELGLLAPSWRLR